eukprot:4817948-Pyramimonas_sp.AAC.1
MMVPMFPVGDLIRRTSEQLSLEPCDPHSAKPMYVATRPKPLLPILLAEACGSGVVPHQGHAPDTSNVMEDLLNPLERGLIPVHLGLGS